MNCHYVKQTVCLGLSLFVGLASAATIEPDWESMAENYRVPKWFQDGKVGIIYNYIRRTKF